MATSSTASKAMLCPERADIIWIEHDPQVGKEMQGMHPMLVLSPHAFNERTGIVIGYPMTHAAYNADNAFAVAIQGPRSEISYILCHQPKSFDWRMRGGGKHPWGSAPPKIMKAALEKLDAICGVCTH
jgi:mRNA interferase MazF